MKIFFEQKKPGRVRQTIKPVLIELGNTPSTVSGLIEETVRICVEAFNRKAIDAPDRENLDADESHNVLSQQEIENLADTGRIAFGIVYNGNMEDPDKAVANALQCYEDGLLRMFLNGNPLGDVNEKIELKEGDCITVVRLTLLAGRLW